MSKPRMRNKSAREAYVEQFSYNKNPKRKSLTHLHSDDDSDVAYRSAPEYLKQLMNTSTVSNGNSARTLTRTYSASDMTPRNLGNPKYKAQEDYYDEVQLLKKELKSFKEDNSNLRAKMRRLEEDNARKSKEIDGLYDTTKDGDLRRTLTASSTPTSNIVMNLKQRLFKLDLQLKQRETTIDEMKNHPRWTKGTELEIQNRALFNELEKQKVEKLHFVQHDYMAAIDEEKKSAVRKLETEKRELKIENENLKKKVQELKKSTDRSEQSSPRHRDGSGDRDPLQKIVDLKELCRKYEDEIEQMKDDLKQMRRERDKYRDKFENVNEDLEQLKRERDQYRQKFHTVNNEHDRQIKLNQTGRSSPVLKRDDERVNKRPQSSTLRRDSNSSEEFSKKDSRPSTPIRKSNEHINPRSSMTSKKSSQNLRQEKRTSDDDNRVKKFREKHAATVIQRGWRNHHKSHKNSFLNKTKQENVDKRNSKTGGMASPRSSQQKLGSKIDNLGSGTIKTRPSSANVFNESALKTVQAALRGYINRTEFDKSSRTQKFQRPENDNDDIFATQSRYTSDRKRDDFLNHSKQNLEDYTGSRHEKIGSNSRLPTSNRDSTSKLRQTPSPPHDNYRPLSPHIGTGSKQNLNNDRNKLGSGNRYPFNDRELPTRPHRSSSPPADIPRSSSPRNTGSKQSLLNDKTKLGYANRLDRDSSFKPQHPSPPSPDHRLARQSNLSLRKSPTNSKQSLQNIHNDDDDNDVRF